MIGLATTGISLCELLSGCGGGLVIEASLDNPSADSDDTPQVLVDDGGAPSVDARIPVTIEAGNQDAGSQAVGCSVLDESATNVRLVEDATLGPFLATESGDPLYMYAGDVASSGKTTCLGDCAKTWAPFDLSEVSPDCSLSEREFARFHRDDGAWQTTYKGHPLYLRADGTAPAEVEGTQGRWFLAKDYLVFLSTRPGLIPLGTSDVGAPFLTDGFGRALYICLDDLPGAGETVPVSSCTGACTQEFPVWSSIQTLRTTRLPSIIAPQEFSAFQRQDGSAQLTFRGWPLYQYAEKDDVQGHNIEEWRLIGPPAFVLSE